MRNFTRWLSGACIIASLLLSACHTGREAYHTTAHKKTHPEFIKDITLGGGNKSSSISMNVVDKHHRRKEEQKDIDNTNATGQDDKEPPGKPLVGTHAEDAGSLAAKYAAMLGVMPKFIKNFSLYRFIDEWYGVDYRLGGCDKSGIDCSAFVQRLYEQVFGTTLLRTAIEQYRDCDRTKNMSKIREGDLVFFHIHSRHVTHVGIYLTNHFFVHASASQGVVISNLNDHYWRKYFAGSGRIKS